MSRAIKAIEEAERSIEPGKPADPLILKKLIEAIDMQDAAEVMKKYYSDDAWAKYKNFYEEGPSEDWPLPYREVAALLDEDPASEKAQTLADRWLALLRQDTNYDPEGVAGTMKAWMDFKNWPESIRQRLTGFQLDKVRPFIQQAVMVKQKKDYNNDEEWERLIPRSQWVTLLLRANMQAGQDPDGEQGQELAVLWKKLMARGGGPASATREAFEVWLGPQRHSAARNLIDANIAAEFLSKAIINTS